MIVRNEERFLRDALASVQGVVDEICIVDTGSTDGNRRDRRVVRRRVDAVTWRDDFAWARKRRSQMATGAWIFVLDADERLAPGSRAALRGRCGVAARRPGPVDPVPQLQRRRARDRRLDQRDRPDLPERSGDSLSRHAARIRRPRRRGARDRGEDARSRSSTTATCPRSCGPGQGRAQPAREPGGASRPRRRPGRSRTITRCRR